MDDAAGPAGEVVALCRELIRIDSTNYGDDSGPGERAAGEQVAAWLGEVGIEAQVYESRPTRMSVVADWAPDGIDTEASPLLIHGHLDVVPANAADWTYPPFAAEVADGCVWGRGAVDMKDFDAMVLSVVRDRARTGRPPRRPIRLVFTADEEAGSILGAHWLMDHHPEVVEGCVEAIGEVGGYSLTVREDRRLYLIQTAEKGLAWLDLVARGRAGHGSFRHLDNAVTDLARAVARIGTHRWPPRITDAQRELLATLEEECGIEVDPDNPEESLSTLGTIARLIGATLQNTANPTMLRAGYKHNVIPGEATAAIDGRFVPGGEEELRATIRALVGDLVEIRPGVSQPAVETDFSGDLVDAMRASLIAHDPGARAVPYLMSGGTDAKAWDRAGIRCFGFAPLRLPPDLDFVGMFHGVDERVPTDALEFGARVLDHFLELA